MVMNLVFHPLFLQHSKAEHPENPERLSLIDLTNYTKAKNGEKYLELAHSKEYINKIKALQGNLDINTYTNEYSYEAACLAAGATVQAMNKEAFALVRPPGHHAPFGGFCLFNNVVIAALASKKRVFIIDWDVHHGNGTQDLVLGNENIQYFSTHQSPLYPGTGLTNETNCINVPLPSGTGDKEYLSVVEKVLKPALEEFQPEIVGVSAGFDSYYKDNGWLSNFQLTNKSYEAVLKTIGDTKTFFCLEGGYNPESVKDGVETVLNFFG